MDFPENIPKSDRETLQALMDNDSLSLNEKFDALKIIVEDPVSLVKILAQVKLSEKEKDRTPPSKHPSEEDFLGLVQKPTRILFELLLKQGDEKKIEKVISNQTEEVRIAYEKWRKFQNKASQSADATTAKEKTEMGNKSSSTLNQETVEEFYVEEERGSGAQFFPSLQNDSSNCFLNSVVWCILNTVMSALIASEDSFNEICVFIRNMLSNNTSRIKLSTASLRNLFPDFATGQHDAAEFYRAFVEKLPDRLKDQMSVRRTVTVSCNKCNKKERKEITDVSAESVYLHDFAFCAMIGRLTAPVTVREECDICGNRTNHTQTAAYNAESSKIFALDFCWANEDQHVYDRPEKVQLFGFEWRLVAAIEYNQTAENGKDGHYWAWVQTDGRWYTLDDLREEQVQVQESFKDGHERIKMLFFEKIE